MSNRKTSKTSHGYVVDHKESPVRYAVSPANFNPKIHTKVRDLDQSETVRSFRAKRAGKKSTPAPTSPQAPSSEGSTDTTK